MTENPDERRHSTEKWFADTIAAKLATFSALLVRWNARVNLVSASTLPILQRRHIEDSAQLAAYLPADARSWADLGSGGGFPGLIVAIILQDQGSPCRVILVESDQRKAAFLREAARVLATEVEVVCARIEAIPPLGADVVSARALAPLPVLLGYAVRHLAPSGTGLFLKGAGLLAELGSARRDWTFDAEMLQSQTDAEGTILRIQGLRRAD